MLLAALRLAALTPPEEAIEYFIDRVKEGDIDGALSVCAYRKTARLYDYEKMIKRADVMDPRARYLPSEYELYVKFNESSGKEYIIKHLCHMAISAGFIKEDYEDLFYIQWEETEFEVRDFDELIPKMDPDILKGIEIEDIGKFSVLSEDRFEDYVKDQIKITGAEDMTIRAVLYSFDGDYRYYYAGDFQLEKRNGKWLISSLNNFLPGSFGSLIRIGQKAEFEDILEMYN